MNKKVLVFVVVLFSSLTALAGPCPANIPPTGGSGTVAGVSVPGGGLRFFFADSHISGFDCFETLSGWFPSNIHSASASDPKLTTIDMAYTIVGTATFNNVVVPAAGNYTMDVRYAFAEGLFPGVKTRYEGVMVNGVVINSAVPFPETGDFEAFQDITITIPLNAGVNTIQFFNSTREGVSRMDAITLTPTAPGATSCVGAPNAPAALTGMPSLSDVSLTWNATTAPNGCTVSGYNVYRSTTPPGGPDGFTPSVDTQLAGGITTTSFDDKTVSCGNTYYYAVQAVDAAGVSAPSNFITSSMPACPIISSISINAQGPAIGSFVADELFSGGGIISHTNPIDLTGVVNPAPMSVYQKARSGNFSYIIPGFIPGETKTVRLHFAETFFSTGGSRTFNVNINGTQVLTNFDIFAASGAKNKAIIEEFKLPASSTGQYVITFSNVVNTAMVSAIEIQ
jgi:Malectin domain